MVDKDDFVKVQIGLIVHKDTLEELMKDFEDWFNNTEAIDHRTTEQTTITDEEFNKIKWAYD